MYSPDQINAMGDREYKSYESRLRRAVHRQGYRLERSRRRDPRAYDYGTYMIIDPQNNTVAAYRLSGGYGLDLADVARRVNE